MRNAHTIIIKECQINNIMAEMKNASFNNSEYIISMLQKGFLAHGSPVEDLTSFDETKIQGGTRGEYGYGFYFTDELYKCIEYGSNIYFTPKGAYNFLELRGNGQFQKLVQGHEKLEQEYHQYQEAMYDAKSIKEYDFYENECNKLKELLYKRDDSISFFVENAVRKYGNTSDENIFKYINGNLPSDMVKGLSEWLMSFGYDGVHCGNQYCIFNTTKLNSNIKH